MRLRGGKCGWVLVVVGALALSAPSAAGADPVMRGTTTRVTVNSAGEQGDGGVETGHPGMLGFSMSKISGDGRHVVFVSGASNFDPDPDAPRDDLFVHDRVSGVTERLVPGYCRPYQSNCRRTLDDGAFAPAISYDGRHVAFRSFSSNVVSVSDLPFDAPLDDGIFVRDRGAGTTRVVSIPASGARVDWDSAYLGPPDISADGRFVTFESSEPFAAGEPGFFVRDMVAGRTNLVSIGTGDEPCEGGDDAIGASISADGRFVGFQCRNDGFWAGDVNGWPDGFVRDRLSGITEIVSVSTSGEQGRGGASEPVISDDGRYAVFYTSAGNLARAWIMDQFGEAPREGYSDGSVVIRDREMDTTEIISLNTYGFKMYAGYDPSADISSDGRYVAFSAVADQDDGMLFRNQEVFVRDRLLGVTYHASVSETGMQADGTAVYHAEYPSISADGQAVSFVSWGWGLVPNDTNESPDLFVRDRQGPCWLDPACVPWPS